MTEEQDPTGSVGEEAARLLHVLAEWAEQSRGEYAEAASTAAAGVHRLLQQVDEHVATGGADCRYCPLCQLIAAARETRPEMRQRLATAGSSLLQVASDILAAAASEDTGRRDEPVQKIDLDADWEDEH